MQRLFPATVVSPATVFSFDLLENFHQLTLCSKITPYDYFDALAKLTSSAFPQDVEVWYLNCVISNILTLMINLRTGIRS